MNTKNIYLFLFVILPLHAMEHKIIIKSCGENKYPSMYSLNQFFSQNKSDYLVNSYVQAIQKNNQNEKEEYAQQLIKKHTSLLNKENVWKLINEDDKSYLKNCKQNLEKEIKTQHEIDFLNITYKPEYDNLMKQLEEQSCNNILQFKDYLSKFNDVCFCGVISIILLTSWLLDPKPFSQW